MRSSSLFSAPWTWTTGEMLSVVLMTMTLSSLLWKPVSSTECRKKKYFVNIFGDPLNHTVTCPMYFQWTVSDFCCYGKYDRYDLDPYCCYSDTYKLVIAVGIICLVLLGTSCVVFFCWAYNLPHHILYVLSCGKFNLTNWMKRSMVNGPYVDPSFYAREPFWTRGGAEIQPYPLRPMPPRIFYPAAPANIKFRWDSMASSGQMPLFIVASRQFTRNPYSARPSDRSTTQNSMIPNSGADSRRSSTTTLADAHNNRYMPLLEFHVNMDEMEAAAELLEALKKIEEKGDKSLRIPAGIPEETLGSELEPQQSLVVATPEQKKQQQQYQQHRRQLSHRQQNWKHDNSIDIISELDHEDVLEDIEFSGRSSSKPVPVLDDSMLDDNKLKNPPPPPPPRPPTALEVSFGEEDTESHIEEPELHKDIIVPNPPATPASAISLGEEAPAVEVSRLEIPYTEPKLPGSVPD